MASSYRLDWIFDSRYILPAAVSRPACERGNPGLARAWRACRRPAWECLPSCLRMPVVLPANVYRHSCARRNPGLARASQACRRPACECLSSCLPPSSPRTSTVIPAHAGIHPQHRRAERTADASRHPSLRPAPKPPSGACATPQTPPQTPPKPPPKIPPPTTAKKNCSTGVAFLKFF